jgi:hypothetical protein
MGRQAVLAMGGVLLLIATGCPEEWGRGGAIDQAVQRDMEEALEQECPVGKRLVRNCDKVPRGAECPWECR